MYHTEKEAKTGLFFIAPAARAYVSDVHDQRSLRRKPLTNILHSIIMYTERREKMTITSIRLDPETEKQINWIKEWLADLPFTDVKKPSTSEVIRICINCYYNEAKREEKI